ncbi:ABC transporter ATP-binding protein/permease [Legionella lytica]|uniref:ABC transporter ATP-binding protein/permease n=1 Tax=Legionella lytica TaxID=96232 RepID=A0ABW8D9J1_9GAMM
MQITGPNATPNLMHSMQILLQFFFEPATKWNARLLFAGLVLSVLTLTGLGIALGWWCFPSVYTAFIAKDTVLLFTSALRTLLIASLICGSSYGSNCLKNKLFQEWGSWLTSRLTEQYNKHHLKIFRSYRDKLDNPEQRIQEDAENVVQATLDLSVGLIENLSNFIMFTTLLAVTGGPLSLSILGLNIVIPGFFIWVALLTGICSSVIAYFVSSSLQTATLEETKCRSNFRANLQQLTIFSEEIALEGGSEYFEAHLKKNIDEFYTKSLQRLSIQNRVNTFNMFINTVQALVPFFAAAPLYYNDVITLDAFFSIGYYFSMVTRSLNWFINSFEKINQFQSSLSRITELQQVFDENNSSQGIMRIISAGNELEINDVKLTSPNDGQVIIKGLNLKFSAGIDTMIQALSGTGKSTLYKAIGGTWLSGEGEIIIPHSLDSIYFLPQTPTIPDNTLRNILAYPQAECKYSDAELLFTLEAVGMGHLAEKLDERIQLNSPLSLGQKQRIALARVLLRKPDWVFLDEATASLDEKAEATAYTCLKENLPNITIISIAHRSTVKRYHNRVLFFNMDSEKDVQISEQACFESVALIEPAGL